MNIKCQHCQARYRLDEAVLKGAKGALVRCRSCGNSILVMIPGETNSDISVLHSVRSSQNHSEINRTDPAVFSSAKEKRSPPSDVGQVFPVEEWECAPEKNREEKESMIGNEKQVPPVSVPDHKPSIFYPPWPKSPSKVRHRRIFRWHSIFSMVLFLRI